VSRSIDKLGIPSNHYTPSRLLAIEELPLALGYIVLHNGDFLEAVKDGVSSGRDTDSIGVMIGAILGAMHGVQAIPAEELAAIEEINRQDIKGHCTQFSEAAAFMIDRDLRMNDIRQQQIRSIT
jgi:ADP-ribosylglycohydrolase